MTSVIVSEKKKLITIHFIDCCQLTWYSVLDVVVSELPVAVGGHHGPGVGDGHEHVRRAEARQRVPGLQVRPVLRLGPRLLARRLCGRGLNLCRAHSTWEMKYICVCLLAFFVGSLLMMNVTYKTFCTE